MRARPFGGAQNAAIRACRNALEFNSIPFFSSFEGGRQAMKISVKLGVPPEAGGVDLDALRATFPYGQLLPVEIVHGGLTFKRLATPPPPLRDAARC